MCDCFTSFLIKCTFLQWSTSQPRPVTIIRIMRSIEHFEESGGLHVLVFLLQHILLIPPVIYFSRNGELQKWLRELIIHPAEILVLFYNGSFQLPYFPTVWHDMTLSIYRPHQEHNQRNDLIVCIWTHRNLKWCIWKHKYGSTLGQVMVCCLTASINYMKQCWFPFVSLCGLHTRVISTASAHSQYSVN